jgi:hypothetical protein
VGAAVNCTAKKEGQHYTLKTPYITPSTPPNILSSSLKPPHLLLQPQWLLSSPPEPPQERQRELTSPHAAGEAASGDDRARCDGAPGDSGNSATGEHVGRSVVEWSGEGIELCFEASCCRCRQVVARSLSFARCQRLYPPGFDLARTSPETLVLRIMGRL